MSHHEGGQAMTLHERIDAAIKRITSGHGAMRIPAEDTDPDLVLMECRAHIDGEPARLAVAMGAREEVVLSINNAALRDANDEIAALRKDRDEMKSAAERWLRQRDLSFDREEALRARVAELERTLRINSQAHIETGKLREKAEAERDELLERHAEFERSLSELDSAKRALKHMTEDRDRLRGLLEGWSPV